MLAADFTLFDGLVIGAILAITGVLLVFWARPSHATWLVLALAVSLATASTFLDAPLKWVVCAALAGVALRVGRRMDRRGRDARRAEEQKRIFE